MHLVVTFGIIKPMETIVLLMTIEKSIVSYSEFHLNMKLCKAQVSGNKVQWDQAKPAYAGEI